MNTDPSNVNTSTTFSLLLLYCIVESFQRIVEPFIKLILSYDTKMSKLIIYHIEILSSHLWIAIRFIHDCHETWVYTYIPFNNMYFIMISLNIDLCSTYITNSVSLFPLLSSNQEFISTMIDLHHHCEYKSICYFSVDFTDFVISFHTLLIV